MSSNESALTILEELFANHATGLTRFLSRKLNNKESAEDIAQDAFARLQKLSDIGDLKNPKAYLYKTAVNLLIDEKRREELRKSCFPDRQPSEPFDERHGVDTITPERLLSARQQIKILRQALDGMPAKHRHAFLLHRINGMSYSEIAGYMGVSVSSVEKYLIAALRHCRKMTAEKTDD